MRQIMQQFIQQLSFMKKTVVKPLCMSVLMVSSFLAMQSWAKAERLHGSITHAKNSIEDVRTVAYSFDADDAQEYVMSVEVGLSRLHDSH